MRFFFAVLFAFSLVTAQDTIDSPDTVVNYSLVDSTTSANDSVAASADSTSVDSVSATVDSVSEMVDTTTVSGDSSNDVDSLFPDSIPEDSVLVAETEEVSENDTTATVEETRDVVDTVSAVIEESTGNDGGSNFNYPLIAGVLILVVAVIILLVRMMKRGRDKENFLTRTRISIMDREVQLVCRYIEEHYADPSLTAESVCTALSTGMQFVETLFHKELDMTIEGFINHVRIHHAVNRINDGYAGEAEELMKLCGYSEIAKFEHDFYTVTGVQLSTLLNTYK